MGLRHIDHIATLIPGMDEERASVEAGRDTVSQDIVRTEALEKAALKVYNAIAAVEGMVDEKHRLQVLTFPAISSSSS